MNDIIKIFQHNVELLFWVAALVCLYFLSPGGEYFSLCPLHNLDFNFCLGCGIGHSIYYGLHLDFKASFDHHIAGLPAILIIMHRIFQLIHNKFSYHEQKTYSSNTGH